MTSSSDKPARDLTGYELLVGVCGGIAAYKVCEAVSALVQRGVGVTVAMTKAARKFVGPVTFQALTGRRVFTSLWQAGEEANAHHIALSETADLVLIAPATANIIAKMAAGIADDLVSTLVVSAVSPVVLAPAMNERMWANPIVQRNVTALTEHGCRFIGPAEGWLACGHIGPGRMVEPPELVDVIVRTLKETPAKIVSRQE
jgi:phosphopantothenoylcysteine decarboxylase/phosphopantothenate--cysteine ligase